MTPSEAQQFFRRAFIAFPGVKEWLERYSDNPPATLAVWAKTLVNVSLSEADAVLDRWISASLPAPQGYQREHFAIHVRQVVQADRDRAHRERSAQEVRAKVGEKPLRGNYVSHVPYSTRMFENGDRFKAGEISAAELDSLNAAILREFEEACESSNQARRRSMAEMEDPMFSP